MRNELMMKNIDDDCYKHFSIVIFQHYALYYVVHVFLGAKCKKNLNEVKKKVVKDTHYLLTVRRSVHGGFLCPGDRFSACTRRAIKVGSCNTCYHYIVTKFVTYITTQTDLL